MASFVIYIAFLVTLTGAVIWTPSLGITAVTFVFALDQWGLITSQSYISHQSFTNYAIGAIVLLALSLDLGKRLSEKTGKPYVGAIFWLTALLFFYAYLSSHWIATPYTWAAEIDRRRSPDALWASQIPDLALFAFAAPFLVRTQSDVTRIAKALIILGLPLVVFLLLNLELYGRRYVIGDQLAKLNPLEMARFGGILAIVSACMFRESRVWKVVCIIGIILGLGLILKSETRGQLISSIICVCIILLLSYGRISTFSLVLKISISAVVLISVYFLLSIDSVVDFIESLIGTRIATDEGGRFSLEGGVYALVQLRWEPAFRLVDIWLSSPVSVIFGLGGTASYAILGNHPHNVPLEIMCELGLIGLGIYLTILFLVVKKSMYILRLSKQSGITSHAIWLFPFLALFDFIGSLKENSLLLSWYLFMAILLVERVALICSSQASEPQAVSQRSVSPFDGRNVKAQ